MRRIIQLGHALYDVLTRTIQQARRDDLLNLAAGLAFFGILSLIPLTFIMISIFGHVLGASDALFQQIVLWIHETIPGVEDEFVELLRGIVTRKFTSGWIGLIFLFFAASLLFTNMEKILDLVLHTDRRRNFWHSRALAIVLILVTSLLFFAPALLNVVAHFVAPYGVDFQVGNLFRGDGFFFVAHTTVFAFLLRVVPNQSVPLRRILPAAIGFGALALAARWVFHAYMALSFERFHLLYGSLTVLVMLILWLYYLSLIFVVCAMVISSLREVVGPQRS